MLACARAWARLYYRFGSFSGLNCGVKPSKGIRNNYDGSGKMGKDREDAADAAIEMR